MLSPRKALFLCGGDNSPVAHQARGAVVIKRTDPEDIHRCLVRRGQLPHSIAQVKRVNPVPGRIQVSPIVVELGTSSLLRNSARGYEYGTCLLVEFGEQRIKNALGRFRRASLPAPRPHWEAAQNPRRAPCACARLAIPSHAATPSARTSRACGRDRQSSRRRRLIAGYTPKTGDARNSCQAQSWPVAFRKERQLRNAVARAIGVVGRTHHHDQVRVEEAKFLHISEFVLGPQAFTPMQALRPWRGESG